MVSTSSAPAARLPQVRLRLPTGWITLPQGQHEIGRSSSCAAVLDGERVSRLHARLVVDERGASISDLSSSNGVFVNGERLLFGTRRLSEGDVIRLGEFDVLVSYQPGDPPTGPIRVRDAPLAAPTVPPDVPTASGFAVSLDLLGSVAERVMDAGEPQRAEGMLQGALDRMLESARSRKPVDPKSQGRAIHLALRLARALGAPGWVHWVLDLLGALPALLSEMQAAELERTIVDVPGVDVGRIAALLAVVQSLPPSLDKLRTAELLERLAAAGARA